MKLLTLFLALVLSFPAVGQDKVCADYFDAVVAGFTRMGQAPVILSEEQLADAKELYHQPDATRAFFTYFHDQPVFGFEVDGCLIPPVSAVPPKEQGIPA